MLQRQHRLRTVRAFRQLQKSSKTAGSRYLVARYRKTADDAPFRLAVVISKKTEKRAVFRNRARRQVHEIFRSILPHLVSGVDVSLSVKPAFLPLSYDQKKEEVKRLLKRADLLRTPVK